MRITGANDILALNRKTKSGSNYEQQANQVLAKNLKGKLLLIHGGHGCIMFLLHSYLVADALMKANKDLISCCYQCTPWLWSGWPPTLWRRKMGLFYSVPDESYSTQRVSNQNDADPSVRQESKF